MSTTQGLEGGNLEEHGVNANREIIDVTEHRHEVELDLTRFELALSRTINESWDATLRLPYFIKEQSASVAFPNGGSPEDRDAARRNGQIHHRSETYEGVGDAEVSVGWRGKTMLATNDAFRFSLGVTLPFGDTEEDPWELGDEGHEHLHVQFGNGTFDPVIDLYYGLPISDHWAVSVYGKARLPFYENDKGYRGSAEAILSPRVTLLARSNLSFWAGLAGTYSGYSHWEETGRDRNSGQMVLLATLGAGYKFNESITASASVLLPMADDTFSDDEDTLELAPTVSLSVAYSF